MGRRPSPASRMSLLATASPFRAMSSSFTSSATIDCDQLETGDSVSPLYRVRLGQFDLGSRQKPVKRPFVQVGPGPTFCLLGNLPRFGSPCPSGVVIEGHVVQLHKTVGR